MSEYLSDCLNTFSNLSKKPHEFLSVQEEPQELIKGLIKQLYDFTKRNEERTSKNVLPKLIVDKFDEEQIWQELELQNGNFTNESILVVSELAAKKDKLNFPLKLKCIEGHVSKQPDKPSLKKGKKENVGIPTDDENEDFEADEDFEDTEEDLHDSELETEDNEGEEDELSDDNSVEKEKIKKKSEKKGNLKPSIVDDQFFKLADLELFLKNEDKKEDNPGQQKDTFSLFEKMDDGAADYKYSDFFENPENFGDEEKYNDYEEDTEDNHEETNDVNKKNNIDKEESDESEGNDEDGSDESEESDEDGSDESEGSDEDGSDESEGSNEDGSNESEDESEDDNFQKKNKTKRKHEEQVDSSDDDDEGSEHAEVKKKKVRFTLQDAEKEKTKRKDDNGARTKDLFGSSKKTNTKTQEVKSTLEQRQERLERVIGRLEEEALAEKPWQLKGEISGSLRPENSLLEEIVDFDLSVRPAPLMTEEVTMKLEDVITQRIKDKAWDDVERKVKPVDTPSEFKKKLALDQEKSKLSLAEVYEQEFIKQREAATADDSEKQEEEPALHVEVRNMLHSLFNKLDALSNYHYTPRPIAPEMKVVSNVAAITMEEVAPVSVADSALLAPQEVRGKKPKVVLKSKEERTDTDRKRARRLKKTKQRQRQREKERTAKEVSKINPGLGNKYSKLKAEKQILDFATNNVTKMDQKQEKVVKSSTTFFNKLQDEVKSQIKSKTSSFTKKKDKRTVTAKKLKL